MRGIRIVIKHKFDLIHKCVFIQEMCRSRNITCAYKCLVHCCKTMVSVLQIKFIFIQEMYISSKRAIHTCMYLYLSKTIYDHE